MSEVKISENLKRLTEANSNLIRINQEIYNDFGNHKAVRDLTLSILQNIIQNGTIEKEAINRNSQDFMLRTPNYWLSRCTRALSAWVCNDKATADKAIADAVKRDKEKASLFFALVCIRFNRKEAAFKWLKLYFSTQSAYSVNRDTMIVMDAFANGLLGPEMQSFVYGKCQSWIDELYKKHEVANHMREKWFYSMEKHYGFVNDEDFPWLAQFSPQWPEIKKSIQKVQIHERLENYFASILNKKVENKGLVTELDEVLKNLLYYYEESEKHLYEQKEFEELVIKYKGDEAQAQKVMKDNNFFKSKKAFTELLVDFVFNQKLAHTSISAKKTAIALSVNFILDAYRDLTAQYRIEVPQEISYVSNDLIIAKTVDGRNTEEAGAAYLNLLNEEEKNILAGIDFTIKQKFYISIFTLMIFYGLIDHGFTSICGLCFAGYKLYKYSKIYRVIRQERQRVRMEYTEYRENVNNAISNFLAEVAEYRRFFSVKDKYYNKIMNLLEQVRPIQYIKSGNNNNCRNIYLGD